MPYYQSTYHSSLYRNFREIEPADFRKIIRFFEENEQKIHQLDEEEHFDLLVAYVNALFEIGAYQKHLLMVDLVIEKTLDRNIRIHEGVDLFNKSLFKKAASLYNTMQYAKAEHILKELIKIHPGNEDALLFLKKCLRKKELGLTHYTRAAGIFLLLLTALVIAIELLFIRPFYEMYVNLVETTRISMFGMACIILFGGDLLHRWKSNRKADRFVHKVKMDKKRSFPE